MHEYMTMEIIKNKRSSGQNIHGSGQCLSLHYICNCRAYLWRWQWMLQAWKTLDKWILPNSLKKLVGAEPSPCCSFAHHLTDKKWWSIAHLLITKHSPENYAPWLKKNVFCYWRAGAGEKYFLRTSSRHRISRYREIVWLSNRVFVQYIHHLESRWRNSHVVSCSGLSWPLTKPPFGSCAIYIFCSYMFNVRIYIYNYIIYTQK